MKLQTPAARVAVLKRLFSKICSDTRRLQASELFPAGRFVVSRTEATLQNSVSGVLSFSPVDSWSVLTGAKLQTHMVSVNGL